MSTPNGSAPLSTGSPRSQDAPSLDFSTLLLAIRRRWRTVLLTFIGCITLALLYAFLRPPLYRASSVVFVNTAQQQGAGSDALTGALLGLPERTISNEVEILKQSMPLAEAVAARILGADSAAVARRDSAIVAKAKSFIGPERPRVTFATVSPQVDLLTITAVSRSPAEAARIANVYAELYQQRGRDQSRASVTNARAFLEGQVAERRSELAGAEAALSAYMTQAGVVDLSTESEQVVNQVAAIDAEVADARVDLEVARAGLQAVEQQLGQVLPDLADRVASGATQQIAQLQERIAQLQIQASDFYAVDPSLRGNEERNPELAVIARQLRESQEQVDQLSSQYVRALQASGGVDATIGGEGLSNIASLQSTAVDRQIEIQGIETRLNLLRQRQQQNDAVMRTLPTESIQLAQLQRNRDALEEIYLGLIDQLQDLRVTEAAELGYIQLIREATVPDEPVAPRPILDFVLGAIMGLLFGVSLALYRHATDHLLRAPEDVEGLGFTLLGGVPSFDQLIKRKFGGRRFVEVDGRDVSSLAVASLHPLSPVTEAFRHLRTSIHFSLPDRPIRTLLVTSPEPEEGKSTIALALAIAFTQAGRRVLYVDADLRKPTGHALLGLPREGGLSDLLFSEGPVDWETYRCPLHIDWGPFESEAEGLYALTAGQNVPNPTELLGSQKMRDLLAEAGAHFDLVVVDSAPILAVPEARLLAADCDAVLLVAREHRSSLQALRQARRTLEATEPGGAHFIGVVVNSVERQRRQGGYGYSGYGYGGYGYGDANFGAFETSSGDGAVGAPRLARAGKAGEVDKSAEGDRARGKRR